MIKWRKIPSEGAINGREIQEPKHGIDTKELEPNEKGAEYGEPSQEVKH